MKKKLLTLTIATLCGLPPLSLAQTGFWQLNGNSGTTAGTNFLGTTDNQPLELRVNGLRALRLEPNAPTAPPNIIAGFAGNFVRSDAVGSVIGGGGEVDRTNSILSYLSVIGGGSANTISGASPYSTIGGGTRNAVNADGAAWSSMSTIGGGFSNWISGGSSTIAGGYQNVIVAANNASIGGGWANNVQANESRISGGSFNGIDPGAYTSVIGGGHANGIHADSYVSVIGGGRYNRIDTNSPGSTIAGGEQNNIQANAMWSNVGGGYRNTIWADRSVINGGQDNIIAPGAAYATVPGGLGNVAAGFASLAAGRQGKANHAGAFVWADNHDQDFISTAENQFLIRATGGVGINKNNPAAALDVAGNAIVSGKMTCQVLELTSDRHQKTGFAPVDNQAILDQVARLPITTWRYTNEPAVQHIGPVAQDFKAAFNVGSDDRHIATVDADGVALAAIQALNDKVEALVTRVTALEKENARLRSSETAALQKTRNLDR